MNLKRPRASGLGPVDLKEDDDSEDQEGLDSKRRLAAGLETPGPGVVLS